MEANGVPAASEIDLGPDGQDDPFKDVPADPLAEAGIEQGSLPGHNPSEEEPIAGPEDEPLVEPTPDEILADPDEQEAGPGEEEEEHPVGEAAPPPEEAPGLVPEPEPEEQPEPETPVADTPPEEGTPPPPPPVEKKAPKKSQSKAKKGASKKKQTATTRGYVILRVGAERGEWTEAFERPDADSDEPFVLVARNSTTALRAAYRMLSEGEESPQEYHLVPVPHKLWKPQIVKGRVHRQEAISVG